MKDDPRQQEPYEVLLAQTRGLWKQGDGLQYQKNIRNEWDSRLNRLLDSSGHSTRKQKTWSQD